MVGRLFLALLGPALLLAPAGARHAALTPGAPAVEANGDFPAARVTRDDADEVELFQEFAFEAGGGFRVEARGDLWGVPADAEQRTMLWLLVCDETAYEDHLGGIGTDDSVAESFCADGAYRDDVCVALPFNATTTDPGRDYGGRLAVEATVEQRSYLFFLVANCEVVGGARGDLKSCDLDPDRYCCSSDGPCADDADFAPRYSSARLDLAIDATMCNPGSCLGYNEVGLLALVPAQIAVWAAVSLAWALLLRRARTHRARLHTVMLAMPILHCAERALELSQLQSRDAGRLYDAYQPQTWIGVASLALAYRAVGTLVLLLLARGHSMLRWRLRSCDAWYVALSVLMYAAGWGLYHIGRPLDRSVRTPSVVLLPLALLNVACSVHTASSASLHRLVALFRYPAAAPAIVAAKADIMRRFRVAYTLYVVCTVFVGLPFYFAFRHSNTLEEGVTDGTRLALVLAILALFRPRRLLAAPVISFTAVLPDPGVGLIRAPPVPLTPLDVVVVMPKSAAFGVSVDVVGSGGDGSPPVSPASPRRGSGVRVRVLPV